MYPNYNGRLMDRLVVIAAQQTAEVRQNPDDSEYITARADAMRALVKAWWQVRLELHMERDPNFKP